MYHQLVNSETITCFEMSYYLFAAWVRKFTNKQTLASHCLQFRFFSAELRDTNEFNIDIAAWAWSKNQYLLLTGKEINLRAATQNRRFSRGLARNRRLGRLHLKIVEICRCKQASQANTKRLDQRGPANMGRIQSGREQEDWNLAQHTSPRKSEEKEERKKKRQETLLT